MNQETNDAEHTIYEKKNNDKIPSNGEEKSGSEKRR
jgi:hypothetical protein